jgi:phosphoribosylglycinamide formyltransferase-1
VSGLRVGIAISGGGSNMAALLADMAAPDHPAACVLVAANRPDAGGLARAATAGVATAALDHRAHADREGFDRALSAAFEAAGAELVCLAGFMRLLSPWFVARWRDRLINIHPALLPAFRGLNTHERALAEGVALHGCTVHLVREELDAGPILGQAAVKVRAGEDAAALARRVLAMEHRLYPRVLRAWAEGRLAMRGGRLVGQPIALFEGE